MSKPLPFACVLAASLSLACAGPSAPRAAASPTPAAAADDLRPMSSREAPAAASAASQSPAGATPSLPPGHPPIGSDAAPAPAGAPAKTLLSGTVAIAPKLSAGPSDVLYVMAKKGQTTLVVRRIDKPAFPVSFELSESDAMVSGVPFEGPVDVVARLSRTGDAIPAKGDLEGTTKAVKVPASGIHVTIDSVRP